MTIYILTLMIIVCLYPLIRGIKLKDKKKAYVIIVGIWMFAVLALRSESIGADLVNYIPRYTFFGKASWKALYLAADVKATEIGFAVLNKLLYMLSESPRLLLIVDAGIVLVPILYTVYKESCMSSLSLFLYVTLGFYTKTFSGLRQSIAVSLILLSYKYVRERNFKKFAILVILASTIHISALCVIPIYFIYGIKINWHILIGFGVTYAACLLFGRRIVNFLTLISNYNRYAVSIGKSEGSTGILVIYSALLVLMLFINWNDRNVNASFYILLVLISLVFITLTYSLPIVARILPYFDTMLIFSVPYMLSKINKSSRTILTFVICIVVLLYYLMIICRADTSSIIPYSFFWS